MGSLLLKSQVRPTAPGPGWAGPGRPPWCLNGDVCAVGVGTTCGLLTLKRKSVRTGWSSQAWVLSRGPPTQAITCCPVCGGGEATGLSWWGHLQWKENPRREGGGWMVEEQGPHPTPHPTHLDDSQTILETYDLDLRSKDRRAGPLPSEGFSSLTR